MSVVQSISIAISGSHIGSLANTLFLLLNRLETTRQLDKLNLQTKPPDENRLRWGLKKTVKTGIC